MDRLEKIYNSMLNKTFKYASPVKRIITTPNCKVHKYINDEALNILLFNNLNDIHNFFSKYYIDLMDGSVWADQDFRSSSHLYNPYTKKGLYGRNSAMEVTKIYYNDAITYYKNNKINKSIFYLGATLHIIQDMTVPHHASVDLLKKHKKLESYIRKTYLSNIPNYENLSPHIFSKIAHYIDYNGKKSLEIYSDALELHEEGKHLHISNNILPLAKRSTAGCMIKFYNDVKHQYNTN